MNRRITILDTLPAFLSESARLLSCYQGMYSTRHTMIIWEMLINSASGMKHEAHGTQQPRHINKIGERASTAQRSDSFAQSINQYFLRENPQ